MVGLGFGDAVRTNTKQMVNLSGDILVDGICASGRSFFRFGFFHSLFPRDDLEKAITSDSDVACGVRMNW